MRVSNIYSAAIKYVRVSNTYSAAIKYVRVITVTVRALNLVWFLFAMWFIQFTWNLLGRDGSTESGQFLNQLIIQTGAFPKEP